MSCGAFGGSGNCGGGGGGGGGVGGIISSSGVGMGMGGNYGGQRRCADRGFFDPFCMPVEKPRCEPSCYFNPFVHAQCLGVDMNMQGFRDDILKCQEDYKKAVWAVLKKYAVGDGQKDNKNSSNAGMGNNNFGRAYNNSNNNVRRSNSSGFRNDDPRNQRNRQLMHSRHM